MSEAISTAEISQQLAAYLGHFPAEAAAQQQLQRQADAGDAALTSRKNFAGHVTSSVLVLSHDLTKVLMVWNNGAQKLLQPGGHYDGGSLWFSATREVVEETGLQGLQLHPWHTKHPHPFDWDTHPIGARPAKNEPDHWHHDALYLGLADPTVPLNAQVAEVSEVRWVPIAELTSLPRFQKVLRKLQDEKVLPAATPPARRPAPL